MSQPLLLRAAQGQTTERTPVWLMRQAGRYMTEYREVRKKYGFMDICHQPELAAEVSLQPYKAFAPDGVVLFSDIMTPLADMNIAFTLDHGGPRITKPVHSASDLLEIQALSTQHSAPNTSKVCQTLSILKHELANKDVAILGFCGGPFTLATYIVEGQKSEDLEVIKTLMGSDPQTLHSLLEKLANGMIAYCQAQAVAGAHVIQIFDTWAGMLSEPDYRAFALPYQQMIFKALKSKVPTILYVRAATGYLETLKESGCDCISLDWRVELTKARQILGLDFPLQGNLDPVLMLGSGERVESEARRLIAAGGHQGHILNLGHGLLPNTPRDNVKRFIDTAKQTTPVLSN